MEIRHSATGFLFGASIFLLFKMWNSADITIVAVYFAGLLFTSAVTAGHAIRTFIFEMTLDYGKSSEEKKRQIKKYGLHPDETILEFVRNRPFADRMDFFEKLLGL